MRLVYIYGPPGVGKLTVARELCAMTQFKLVHNHLIVDLVTTIFPHESEGYFRLLRQVRGDVFAAAAQAGVDLVATAVYRGTAEQDASTTRMIHPVLAGGGTPLFVQLTCERNEWLRRLQSDSRRSRGKLTDPQVVTDLLAHYDLFATMPFEPVLRIDTSHVQPEAVARQIAGHFSLAEADVCMAQIADRAAVAALVRAAYAHYIERIGGEPAPLNADYAALIARGVVYVLRDPRGSDIDGVLVMFPVAGCMFIENVAVRPSRQRRGLGRRLMAFAEASAVANGLHGLELYTHVLMTENLQFYQRLGFKEHERRVDHGYPRVFMRKALS